MALRECAALSLIAGPWWGCTGPGSADPSGGGLGLPTSSPAEGEGSHGPLVPYIPYDAGGAPVIGQVGADGGTLSRLLFAVVGDTRPATPDDTEGYPTPIVTAIYADLRALRPRPAMVVSTGDYMFASTSPPHGESQASPQLDIYMQARERFPGAFFPAMGNHECTGATSSNCGYGASNGVTANYSAFLRLMLGPIQKSEPYYALDIDEADARREAGVDAAAPWTAKFVFIAANAWSSTQESWLEATLARPSTYTFVVRHEPASASTAPGVIPSEQIMARHPYTLSIVGHSHTYAHDRETPREVLIGNGGAPLTSKDYGFGVFSQRSDGAIVVDMIHWRTGDADAAFHFAVEANGSPAR
jgi:hypothetical protein